MGRQSGEKYEEDDIYQDLLEAAGAGGSTIVAKKETDVNTVLKKIYLGDCSVFDLWEQSQCHTCRSLPSPVITPIPDHQGL